MTVSILKQRGHLIASIQSALTDTEVIELRDALLAEVARHRARGIIVDVAALDVIDSFVARSLSTVARTNRLRTVVVGIQPEVATAMSQFGLLLADVETALDLEAGLALLDEDRAPMSS
jgi:rsbT antagonist protein RsbS